VFHRARIPVAAFEMNLSPGRSSATGRGKPSLQSDLLPRWRPPAVGKMNPPGFFSMGVFLVAGWCRQEARETTPATFSKQSHLPRYVPVWRERCLAKGLSRCGGPSRTTVPLSCQSTLPVRPTRKEQQASPPLTVFCLKERLASPYQPFCLDP